MRYKVGDYVVRLSKPENYAEIGGISKVVNVSSDSVRVLRANGNVNSWNFKFIAPATKLHKLLAGIETECYNKETEGEHV